MAEADYKRKSDAMVEYLIHSNFLKTKNIIDAFRAVPRHIFNLPELAAYAYEDMALQIVKAATISQPSTVAFMLEELQPREGNKVLEVGTGSGWQACLLSKCVGEKGKVTTIEIDGDVAEFARQNISKYGRATNANVSNINVVTGDGSIGYIDDAPYDKVIMTAACPAVPMQIITQLRIGGRIVAPVGTQAVQTLKIIDKISESKTVEKESGSFQFIPLKGQLGF